MTACAAPDSPAPTPTPAQRRTLASLAALALALSACSRAINPAPAPETQPYAEEPPPPLMGEAPDDRHRPPDETGLLGGPAAPGAEGGAEASATIRFRRPDGVVVSTMKTIPDPEPAPVVTSPPRQGRLHGRIDRSGAMTVTAVPRIVTPAPPPTTAIAPVTAAAPAPPPPPPAEMATAPQAPFNHVLPLAKPADPALAPLQTALAGENAAGAKLSIPNSISKGLAGEVELRLPAGLLAKLKAEAAKLGLGAAARTAEVSAKLSGEGYQIDPSGPQTAALKPDEEIVFNWRVVPGENAPAGPLKAEADLALTGAGAAKTLPLAAIDQTPAPPPPAPVRASQGQTQAKWALAIILVLLAVLVLAGVWRNHKERRRAEAERRQRERAAKAFADESAATEPARAD